jgi:Ras-related protein Rab-8A
MGIMLVFDVTNRKSFSSLKDWMHQIEVHASENVNKMLLGNKCDAPDYQRVVTTEEGMEIAEKFKVRCV